MTDEQVIGAVEAPEYLDDEAIAARARALSSAVRWRVLRACLDEALTNKELADRLGVNPGSMLHHVRTLVATTAPIVVAPAMNPDWRRCHQKSRDSGSGVAVVAL